LAHRHDFEKAVLFDFNGVIINDEPLHEHLIDQILISENLRPNRRSSGRNMFGSEPLPVLVIYSPQEESEFVISMKHQTTQVSKRKAQTGTSWKKTGKVTALSGLEDLIFSCDRDR